MLIATMFVSACAALLLTQILIEDFRVWWRAEARNVEKDFGHDTDIFPDHQYD